MNNIIGDFLHKKRTLNENRRITGFIFTVVGVVFTLSLFFVSPCSDALCDITPRLLTIISCVIGLVIISTGIGLYNLGLEE